jgi:serine/threonine protein kinase
MSVGELRPPPAGDPLIGTVISERYRIIRKLGEGGMGAVYLAEHVFIEKKVALKVLAPELARRHDLSARFLQEAKSASRIGQENVIDISDFGQSPDGHVYIAMEYLNGADLGAAMRDGGAMAWPRAKDVLLQIGKALKAAHAQGIVHRDLKPENIFLIEREGRADFVKLLDFGIAKVMGLGEETPRLTRTGMIFGTPEYMAPEQAEGKDVDHRVDIYALGCVMYQLLTGQTPFTADSFMAILTKHILEEAVIPSARRPDLGIAPEMDAVVMKALEKDKAKRWQSMTEFTDAIAAIQGPPAAAKSGPRSETKELGGNAAPAMKVITTTPRVKSTEMLSRDDADQIIASEATRSVRRPTGSRRLVLVAVGVAVGVGAAVVLALSGRKPSPVTSGASDPPAAVAQPGAGTGVPTSAPEPAKPVAVPETSAAAALPAPGSDPAAVAQPAPGAKTKKNGNRRRSAGSPEPDTAAKGVNMPPELKPFPT